MAEPVDLVLFDLGGVLIEVPGVCAMLELTGIKSEEEPDTATSDGRGPTRELRVAIMQ